MGWEVGVGALLGMLVLVTLLKRSRGWCTSTRSMAGKVVLITGCTSGIGKVTALELAKRGARVIMACRSLSKANAFKEEIVRLTGNSAVEVRQLDLSSLESVRAFSSALLKSESHIDVLIHNAATASSFTKHRSPDGFELTIATNQFGPFLLTHLLIDLIRSSAPCRVVIVASSFYRLKVHDLQNGGNHPQSLPWFLYYLSKWTNIMFSLELARRLRGTGVTVNCLHPGHVDTAIWDCIPFPFNYLLKPFISCLFRNCEEGAQTSLHVAVAEELENVTGKYFSDCKETKLWYGVDDPVAGKKYWEDCEALLLKPGDPRIPEQ